MSLPAFSFELEDPADIGAVDRGRIIVLGAKSCDSRWLCPYCSGRCGLHSQCIGYGLLLLDGKEYIPIFIYHCRRCNQFIYCPSLSTYVPQARSFPCAFHVVRLHIPGLEEVEA